MGIGINLYCGSYTITYDLDEGLSWRSSNSSILKTNALVASEETIRTYLTDHGVDNIKSIKFVEPKFPKNVAAKRCNAMLKYFAEYMAEDPGGAERFRDRLNKYCGVDIQY